MDWKPSSASAACNIGAHCSNSQPKEQPIYTFGHGVKPAQVTQAVDPVSEDMKAAKWWEGGHANKPTTNDARNSDVTEFWQASKGHGAGAIEQLTGKDIAKRVKEAGRGSHITLGVDGSDFTHSSKYKQEFCDKHTAIVAQSIKPAVEDQFFEAKKQARANKALGRGSSVNLSYM